MQPLIAREIRDNLVSVAVPCLAGAITVVLTPFFLAYYWQTVGIGILSLWGIMTPVLLLGFCGLGASQMYSDRANRISSLLATQGVTRGRIFAARILVGLLTILGSLVPLAVTLAVLLWMLTPLGEFYWWMVVEVPLTLLLIGVACYCIGLLVGWTTSKAWLLGGNLLLMVLVISLVAIKGFGPDAMLLLLLLIGAMLLRTWHMFSSASL